MHVQKWLLWTEHLYRLPQVSIMFQELSGRDLCSMTEADCRQRSPQFGDVLYAHLDIWRSGENNGNTVPSGGKRLTVKQMRRDREQMEHLALSAQQGGYNCDYYFFFFSFSICLAAAMKERCPPEDSKTGEFLPMPGSLMHIKLIRQILKTSNISI